MLAYLLCEHFEFSGPIAAVICGLYFATGIYRMQKTNTDEVTTEIHDLFYSFWAVIDNLLNGILFLMVGLLFVDIKNINDFTPLGILAVGVGAIVINTVSRMTGVAGIVSFKKKYPLI